MLRLCFHSRVYRFQIYIEILREWTLIYGDELTDRLIQFADRLIGGTFRTWWEAGVSKDLGRRMASRLTAEFQQAIAAEMARLEGDLLRNERWVVPPPLVPGKQPRNKARDKARRTLIRHLDAGQLKSFNRDGSFRVTARSGRRYTISTARSFNVVDEAGTAYCGQILNVPIEDQMLAQKILLENDEEKFLRNANIMLEHTFGTLVPEAIVQNYPGQVH